MDVVIKGRSFDTELRIFYIIIVLILVLVLLYALIASNWFKRVRVALRLPGPSALPIIGNCLIVTDSTELLNIGNTSYDAYGPVFRFWITFVPLFIITDPKDLQNILGSSKNTDKTFFYSLMFNFLGRGLITSSGHKWKHHRKLLQPTFTINILETFIDSFVDCSQVLVKRLKDKANGNEIKITTFINNAVLDVQNETILGIPVKQNVLNSPFKQGKVVTQHRILQPWLIFDFIFNLTNSGKRENSHRQNLLVYIRQIIEKRREERKYGIYKTDRISLIERMLDIQETNEEFTDDDIVDEITTFMLAGQESIATTVSFCLYFLAKNKDIQDKVYKEQSAIFDEIERTPNMSDLQQMVYLEQCIKETLRLCPSVPIMARKLGESIKIGDDILPTGSDVLIAPYITQRIKQIYPNPDIFDPDRFTADNCEKRPQYSFIPFSAGPRNCIGNKFAMLEMKTMISTIIRHYELTLRPDYNVIVSFRITLRAKGGIWIKLKPRR